MTAYLIANPPRQTQFRERGTKPSGVIVIHTAENTPDWVGPDSGAEAVARFIQGRSDHGSYHLLVDSDSIIGLVPLHLQAYGDGTGSNPHAIHISAATQAAKWRQASPEWRLATARNMGRAAARAAKWLRRTHGVTVPARRISRAQSDARLPGFISHAERDPGRRSDPGAEFPWDVFLNAYQAEMTPPRKLTPRITAAFSAGTIREQRAALRRIVRRDTGPVRAAALAWLAGIRERSQANAKIREARRALRSHEVKE